MKTITHKKDINLTQIENQIQKVDRVSLVSAIIKGNTLVINIKEKVYNPEYEDKENFKPIISVHNAIITEVTVIQGTPMVKAGQVVQKGQILVSPFVVLLMHAFSAQDFQHFIGIIAAN